MAIVKEFISYEGLPIKSGGAHSISGKSPIELYNSLNIFLATVTDNPAPYYIQLQFSNFQRSAKPKFVTYLQLIKKFGFPSVSVDQFLSSGNFIWSWSIVKNVQIALDMIDKIDGLFLSFMWHFQFIDPESKRIIWGQDQLPIIDDRLHNSQAHLRLGTKSTLSLWFTLPFSESDGKYLSYLELLKSLLPVKISNKQWRVWKLSKNYKWIPRKLDINAILNN